MKYRKKELFKSELYFNAVTGKERARRIFFPCSYVSFGVLPHSVNFSDSTPKFTQRCLGTLVYVTSRFYYELPYPCFVYRLSSIALNWLPCRHTSFEARIKTHSQIFVASDDVLWTDREPHPGEHEAGWPWPRHTKHACPGNSQS